MESNADIVYKYTDTNQDGKADKKEFFTDNFGRPGNVEHQQAFLYWGMDNWLYSTVNPFRVRETPNGVVRESLDRTTHNGELHTTMTASFGFRVDQMEFHRIFNSPFTTVIMSLKRILPMDLKCHGERPSASRICKAGCRLCVRPMER
jgi:hypothetical protein